MEFKEEYNLFTKRRSIYKDNLVKAYALLWERCSKNMQHKIESSTDYTSIKDDPLQLLTAIQLYSLSYQEQRYEMTTIYDAMKYLMVIKQKNLIYTQKK